MRKWFERWEEKASNAQGCPCATSRPVCSGHHNEPSQVSYRLLVAVMLQTITKLTLDVGKGHIVS
jgi:hypothetical protein